MARLIPDFATLTPMRELQPKTEVFSEQIERFARPTALLIFITQVLLTAYS